MPIFGKGSKVSQGEATRSSAGPGDIAEAGVWVRRATDRFATCLDTILSSEKRDYVTKWHGETLEVVLQNIHTLENALLDALDKGKGLSKQVETVDVKTAAKISKSDNQAATALRMGTERLVAVEAGWGHSLLLTDGGKVMAFGSGAHGCLGTGQRSDEPSPVFLKATSAVRVMQVTAGCSFSMLLTDGGVVYGVGNNENGQLGVGDRRTRTALSEALVPGHSVAHVSAGAHFSLLVTDEGQVMSCGDGGSGQLGHGSRENVLAPKTIGFFPGKKIRVKSTAAGADHAVCLCQDSSVYSWGRGCFGRLGIGHEKDALEPTHLPDLEQVTTLEISAGGAHTLILARAEKGEALVNHVFSFGCARDGQLGHPRTNDVGHVTEPDGELRNVLRPKIVHALSGVRPVEVAAGNNHSLVQTEQGLYAFGGGAFGRLGLGDYESTNMPTQVGRLEGGFDGFDGFDDAAPLGVLEESAPTAAAGMGALFENGDGAAGERPDVSDSEASSSRPSSAASAAESAAGSRPGSRQLSSRGRSRPGSSDSTRPATPALAAKPGPDIFNGLLRIGAGKDHSIVLTAGGDVFLWGRNSQGQCGSGSKGPVKQNAPFMLPDLRPSVLPEVEDDGRATGYAEGQALREALTAKLDAARTREVGYKANIARLSKRGDDLEAEGVAKSASITSLTADLAQVRKEKEAVEKVLHDTREAKEAQRVDFERRLEVSEATIMLQEEHETRLEPLVADGRTKREYERKLRYRRLDLETCVFNVESVWEERERVRLDLVRQLQESQGREAELQTALLQLNDRVQVLARREKTLANDRLNFIETRSKPANVQEMEEQLASLKERNAQFHKLKSREVENLRREATEREAFFSKVTELLRDDIAGKTELVNTRAQTVEAHLDVANELEKPRLQEFKGTADAIRASAADIKAKYDAMMALTRDERRSGVIDEISALYQRIRNIEAKDDAARSSAFQDICGMLAPREQGSGSPHQHHGHRGHH